MNAKEKTSIIMLCKGSPYGRTFAVIYVLSIVLVPQDFGANFFSPALHVFKV